jgi:hypothetical protein
MLSTLSFGKEIALQIDFAAASIAIIALIFSFFSFRNQRRLAIETLRVQRDSDVIAWTNNTIDLLVDIEFLIRDWIRLYTLKEFSGKRDELLARLSATIDKGRMYFPNFVRDVVSGVKPAAFTGKRQAILDRLVEFYDLVKELDPENPETIEKVRHELMLKKRQFVSHAQTEVEPGRRIAILK